LWLLIEVMRAWFYEHEFVCHSCRVKYWRGWHRLNVIAFHGKSWAAWKLGGAKFKTRQARDDRAAIATDKVVVFVIVGHGAALDCDVGVVPVGRFPSFGFLCFAVALMVVKAGGSFFCGQAISVAAELAIERIEPVSVSSEDVVIAGL
jgi:hypothetical protein